MNSIAVINAGSSSIKFALYDAAKDERCLFRGQVEGIGVAPRLKVVGGDGLIVEQRDFGAAQGFDHDAAMREIVATGRALLSGEPVAARSPRGPRRRQIRCARAVNEAVLEELAALDPRPFASAAQPRADPRDPQGCAADSQIACFDTAFHRIQ